MHVCHIPDSKMFPTVHAPQQPRPHRQHSELRRDCRAEQTRRLLGLKVRGGWVHGGSQLRGGVLGVLRGPHDRRVSVFYQDRNV